MNPYEHLKCIKVFLGYGELIWLSKGFEKATHVKVYSFILTLTHVINYLVISPTYDTMLRNADLDLNYRKFHGSMLFVDMHLQQYSTRIT